MSDKIRIQNLSTNPQKGTEDAHLLAGWQFGTEKDFGVESGRLPAIVTIRKLMVRLMSAPLRSGIFDVLKHFEINRSTFSSFPKDSQHKFKEGYLISIAESIYKGVDKGFGAGTKDKQSLGKIASLISSALKNVRYWEENFSDVTVRIPENRSQWAENKSHLFGYFSEENSENLKKKYINIAPHLLNPIFGDKVRIFLVSLVIAKCMADHWAKKNRMALREKDPKNPAHHLYKVMKRRVNTFGITEAAAMDSAIGNLIIGREILRSNWGVAPRLRVLISEPFEIFRIRRKQVPSFIIDVKNALDRVSLSPKFDSGDILFSIAASRLDKSASDISKTEVSSVVKKEERDAITLAHQKLSLAFADLTNNIEQQQAYHKVTAIGNWLGHKKQPADVIVAGMLLEIAESNQEYFEKLVTAFSSHQNPYLKRASALAKNQYQCKEHLQYPVELPKNLGDNFFEQNEVERVLGVWTYTAQTLVVDGDFDDVIKTRKQIATLAAAKLIFSLNRDYTDLTKNEIVAQSIIGRFSLVPALRKLQLDSIANKIEHEVLVQRGDQYYEIIQSIRESLGMDHEQAENFLHILGGEVKSKVNFPIKAELIEIFGNGIEAFFYKPINVSSLRSYVNEQIKIKKNTVKEKFQSQFQMTLNIENIQKILEEDITQLKWEAREKTPASERSKIFDSYRENLDAILRGEPSRFSDTPTIDEISSTHIDKLGARILFKNQKDLQSTLNELLPWIEKAKSPDVEDELVRLHPNAAPFIREKILELAFQLNATVGESDFVRTMIVVNPRELTQDVSYPDKLIMLDLHLVTEEQVEKMLKGEADSKYKRAHGDMKSSREVVNFAFLSFLREHGIKFTDEGLPVSIQEVLKIYPKFLQSLDSYKPFRSYETNEIDSEYENHSVSEPVLEKGLDGKFKIVPPKELILSELISRNGQVYRKNFRVLAGTHTDEVCFRYPTQEGRYHRVEFHNPCEVISERINFPGTVVRSIEETRRLKVDDPVAPKAILDLLDRLAIRPSDLTPRYAIDAIRRDSCLASKEDDLKRIFDDQTVQTIVDSWTKKIFAPYSGLYELTPNELIHLLGDISIRESSAPNSAGQSEIKSEVFPNVVKTTKYLRRRIRQRLIQSFLSVTAEEPSLYTDSQSCVMTINFDERRNAFHTMIGRIVQEESSKLGIAVSVDGFTTRDGGGTSREAKCLQYTFSHWNQDETSTLEMLHKLAISVASRLDYELLPRMDVAPARRVERKLSINVPRELNSFWRLAAALEKLGLSVNSSDTLENPSEDRFNNESGFVEVLLGCEELQTYRVMEIKDLSDRNYRSDEKGRLKRATYALESEIIEALKEFFTAEQVESMRSSLNLSVIGLDG